MKRRFSRIYLRANLALKTMVAIATIPTIPLCANASTILPNPAPMDFVITKSTPTHTVFLRCEISETKVSISKGSILALPPSLKDPKDDFAIVTGHGLKGGKDCFIQDFHGNNRQVKGRVYANNYKAGTDTDWALISFKAIKGSHIKRYKLESYVSDTELLNNTVISFAQARGLPQNNQNCRLALVEIPMPKESRSLFTHDCNAIPGQSGSPLTQNINGEDKLIGIHLGQIWTLLSPITGSPGILRYMRPFDEDMSRDVKTAIRQLQAE
ncbi:trypsin-like serine peptidase [Hellea balneolensis]|uniref:hypothetical protein n=1 Tax=Hellea balneolensis TaxID=287478 RepID=UPI0004093C55|nr:hypothetical protein [Hellea balneolensis]